jgi:hypothetical protein
MKLTAIIAEDTRGGNSCRMRHAAERTSDMQGARECYLSQTTSE